jgi:DNA repair photolyase
MIKPGVPAPNLAARIGRETLRERAGVSYHELRSRSLVNRCDSPRVPFRFSVNPYRGCAMGCRYCYATYTHEFMGIATPEEFHSTVYVKTGGERQTAADVARLVRQGEWIALGTATDPYQPGEAQSRVTRRFLELVAQHRGARLGITTKGSLILRDIPLLRRIRERSSLSVHVSLISPHAELLRRIEPWAPPPRVRLEVMRRLVQAGIEVALGLAPILPGITDSEPDLDRLLGQVRAAGVSRVFMNVLFLRSPTKEKFLRWLAQAFPSYLEAYRGAYAERVYLRGRYRQRIEATLERLKTRHGFGDRAAGSWRQPAPGQLALWPEPDADPGR